MPGQPSSPVPQEVRAELRRIAGRWRDLPEGRARRHATTLLALAQDLVDDVARREGRPASELPDLGPAVVVDQLTVALYEWFEDLAAAASVDGDRTLAESSWWVGLSDRLIQARRSLT